MKKYIFALNPDDFLYAGPLYTFLSRGNAARIDSICIFPTRASFQYQMGYVLASMRLMGWGKILKTFFAFQIQALLNRLSGKSGPTSIESAAHHHSIPVFRFDDVNGDDFKKHVQSRNAIGILNICSQIYQKDTLLKFPPVYNFHSGYLPGNRGRFPLFWAYVKKLPQFITCHRISEEIDVGDSIYHCPLDAKPTDGVAELMEKTIRLFPEVMEKTISLIDSGKTEITQIPFPGFYGKRPTRTEIAAYEMELKRARAKKSN